jgi:tetratricopeptide (TPR) repeat protein
VKAPNFKILLLSLALAGLNIISAVAVTISPIEQGNALLKKGWVDAAIAQFEKVLQTNTSSVEAHLGLAQAYQKNGNLPAAWEQYQQVLKLDKANTFALQQVGIMGEYQPEWQRAGIIALTQLLQAAPKDAALLTQRALLLGFQGEFAPAWVDYKQIISINTATPILLRAAAAAGFSGYAQESIALYDRILAETPNNPEAQLNRAYFGLEANQVSLAEATKTLDTWLEKNPTDTSPALLNLVGAIPADSQRQALYDRLLIAVPNSLVVKRQALQVLAIQNPDAARSQLAKLMQENPNNPLAYFVQGEVAKTLKDLDLAAQSYETLLQQKPDRPDALIALGGVRFEQKRYGEAEALLNQVLASQPENLEVHKILADLQVTQDHPLLALKLLYHARKISKLVDRDINDRIAQIEIANLSRRSFQTKWEGY